MVVRTNKPSPTRNTSIIRDIGLLRQSDLQRPILHNTAANRAAQSVGARFDGEVAQADLVGVAGEQGRHAEVLCGGLIIVHVELIVAW